MEGVLAIIMIFGMPVFLMGINRFYKYKAKRLELEHKAKDHWK